MPDSPPFSVIVEPNTEMTTRDGTLLRCDIYRPEGGGKFGPAGARKERLTKALRDNLRRRKEQAREQQKDGVVPRRSGRTPKA